MKQRSALLGVSIWLAAASVAMAQAPRSGGGGEAQKFMQQYQQIAAEKTALQAQLAQMKKDLDTAKADLAAVSGGVVRQSNDLRGHDFLSFRTSKAFASSGFGGFSRRWPGSDTAPLRNFYRVFDVIVP